MAVSTPVVSAMVTVSGSVSVFGSAIDKPRSAGTSVSAVTLVLAVTIGDGNGSTVPVMVSVSGASGAL